MNALAMSDLFAPSARILPPGRIAGRRREARRTDMLNDIIAFLISIFVVGPFQAEFADKLAAARAPQAVVAQIGSCASAAVPALAERLSNDWQWVVTRTVGIWIGTTRADTVLGEVVPQCREAIAAARPFLAGLGEA
jgi:hypothetical protein